MNKQVVIYTGGESFSEIIRDGACYVDKTSYLKTLFESNSVKNILFTRPRRFGKSYTAKTLCAYYDHTCDSHELFAEFEASTLKSYEEHINKYQVICIDVSQLMQEKSEMEIGELIQRKVTDELLLQYPKLAVDQSFSKTLFNAVELTGRKFVMIIDEWDAPIREEAQVSKKYLGFLKSIFKGTVSTTDTFAAVYMTGILPIKKDGTQSAVSDFREFTILDPQRFAPYTGFIEDEVKELCDKYHGDALTTTRDAWIKEIELLGLDPQYTCFDEEGRPIFPGYIYAFGKSSYRGENPGEGGYVYAEPGMYSNVALLDIASMHPSSIRAENLFGDNFTPRFNEILDARIAIKHHDFEKAKKMLNGKLAKYLTDEKSAGELAQALKIAINAVYGQTKASYKNPFKDKRNIDNIVAKRGALFMINLKHEVQKRGFTVAHIKTDSIKIPNPTPEIIQFVMDYGKLYGYNFEHEETYDRMCLVNNAVYIAKYKAPHKDKETGEDIWWTPTGDQFAVPYVFKTLFTHKDIQFRDLCETKSVTKGSIYIDLNESLPDVSDLEAEYKKARKKYRDGKLSDISMEEIAERLLPEIEKGHSYTFIGRVGLFSPIKPGHGGGILYREENGKYYAVTGTTGYRWLESEFVQQSESYDAIDESYYISLVDKAIETISQYGDFERFVSGDPLPESLERYMNIPEDSPEEVPFETTK